MHHDTTKQILFHGFARVARALASPARLLLLDLLAQAEKSVDTLARQAGLSITNASNHLKELRTAGLVAARRAGHHVYYRLADPSVHALVRALQDVATRQLAEARQIVRDALEARDALEPVTVEELRRRMRSGDVVVLDVRPPDEYAAGHIPGAVSIPLAELERRISELPRRKEIVAYCRGPYCVFALQALELLRARGYRARRLREGLPDWRARGLEVETGAA